MMVYHEFYHKFSPFGLNLGQILRFTPIHHQKQVLEDLFLTIFLHFQSKSKDFGDFLSMGGRQIIFIFDQMMVFLAQFMRFHPKFSPSGLNLEHFQSDKGPSGLSKTKYQIFLGLYEPLWTNIWLFFTPTGCWCGIFCFIFHNNHPSLGLKGLMMCIFDGCLFKRKHPFNI